MSGNYSDRGDWRNAAHGYRDQRDVLQAQLDQARRENTHLRAVNAVLLRIFADALSHTLPEPAPTERTP
jgi:hypothetical protein